MASTLKTSCAELVDNMPYDRIPQMFGLRGDPQADVPLPLTMTSCTLIPYLHAVFAPV